MKPIIQGPLDALAKRIAALEAEIARLRGTPASIVNLSGTVNARFAAGGGGGLAFVTTDATLTGDGTPGDPLVVVGGGGAGVTDGDKGDITVSSAGANWTVDNGVITTAKMGGDVTTAGKALLDDANAAAQRTTLGLGTAATTAATAYETAGTSGSVDARIKFANRGITDSYLWSGFKSSTETIVPFVVGGFQMNPAELNYFGATSSSFYFTVTAACGSSGSRGFVDLQNVTDNTTVATASFVGPNRVTISVPLSIGGSGTFQLPSGQRNYEVRAYIDPVVHIAQFKTLELYSVAVKVRTSGVLG